MRRPTFDMVKKSQYILNDAHTGERIKLVDPIEDHFTPGRIILMSMCYQEGKNRANFCPGCRTANPKAGSEMTCSSCGLSYREVEEIESGMDEPYRLPFVPNPSRSGRSQLYGLVRVQLIKAGPNSTNVTSFNAMLEQYNDLQQRTMIENMEMQKAQAYWNPIESMSKRDATS